ncbi:hypothetical protein ACIPYQ_13420 [Streptomyces sp. NPDC090045]
MSMSVRSSLVPATTGGSPALGTRGVPAAGVPLAPAARRRRA